MSPPPPPPAGFRRPGQAPPPASSSQPQQSHQRFRPPPPPNQRFAAPPPPPRNGGLAAPPPRPPSGNLPIPPPKSGPTSTSNGKRSFAPPPPPPSRVSHTPVPENSSYPPPPQSKIPSRTGTVPPPLSLNRPPPPQFGSPMGRPAPPPSQPNFGNSHSVAPPHPPPQFSARPTSRVSPPPPPPVGGRYPPMANAINGYAPTPPSQQQQPSNYPEHPSSTAPRIDPAQIPQPPSFTRPGPNPTVFHTSQSATVGGIIPPAADSRYTIVDDGNASPSFLRSTLYTIPKDRGVWHNTGDLPLGVVCTPLAAPSMDATPRLRNQQEQYRDPEAVPLQTTPPERCPHCLVYANAFWNNSNTCNACGTRLSSSTSASPRTGTIEYTVDDGPYCTRSQPVRPVHLYAIDLTLGSTTMPALLQQLHHVGTALADHWERQLQYNMTTVLLVPPRIGICFVSAVGIIIRNRQDDRYMVCTDTTEQPFCGLPLDHWTFTPSQERDAWSHFCNTTVAEEIGYWMAATSKARVAGGGDGLDASCTGAALTFLADALETTGGRGTILTASRPNYGVGQLPYDSSSMSGCPLQLQHQMSTESREYPVQQWYKNLAQICVSARVALSMVFLVPNTTVVSSLGLATLGEVCRATCGTLVRISRADPTWIDTLREELEREALACTGWDVVFKVRCSKGLAVKSFVHAPGLTIENTLTAERELELSCVTQRTSIAVELEHRVGGISTDTAYIQTALLYTNLAGKRRLRVSTLAIPTGSRVPDIFRSVDFGAQSCFLLRETVQCFRSPDTEAQKKARDFVYHKVIHMLANYRKSSGSPPGQLLLPERMQLLPLFCMGLLKSPMLTPNIKAGRSSLNAISTDDRSYYAWLAGQAGPAHAMLMTYPNVFAIDSSTEADWFPAAEEGGMAGCTPMPPTVIPSMESIQNDQVYLVDDGTSIYLHIGDQVDVTTSASLHPTRFLQDSTDDATELAAVVRRMVQQMRLYSSTSAPDLRPNSAPLVWVREPADLGRLMAADASASGEKDYMEFIYTLHRRIRENSTT